MPTRNQFERRLGAFRIPKEELDRMWRREMEIMREMELMNEMRASRAAATSASAGGGGNASGPSPEPLRPLSYLWDSSLAGRLDTTLFVIGLENSYVIDWGDGVVQEVGSFSTPLTHTYEVDGIYNIKIRGGELRMRRNFGQRQVFNEIPAVIDWGTITFLYNKEGSLSPFSGITATDPFVSTLGELNTSNATDFSLLFVDSTITRFNGIEQWDLSNAVNTGAMFAGASSFNGDIGGWDVSNVTVMNSMFLGATSFNADISGWDVGSVTAMNSMFSRATSFNQPIGVWNVGSVTDMSGMFNEAASFNADISGWDVSNVTDMSSMFSNATSFNGDIGGWNVGSVTDMSGMFSVASAFNRNIGAWNVGSVTNMNSMFSAAASFNGDIGAWDVSGVTSMSLMFNNANAFNADIGTWNVGSVTDMSSMFANATVFNRDISGWDVGSVTSMASMFNGASAFNQPIGTWNVGSVTDMNSMFANATSFNADLGAWSVDVVTDMGSMFSGSAFNQDISSWNVSSVTNMNYMFSGTPFNQLIGGWDVTSATSMEGMFYNATAFNVDLGDWEVGSVENMSFMFYGASTFDQDLSGWCVSLIPSEPTDFATGSALSPANYPVWGTCPTDLTYLWDSSLAGRLDTELFVVGSESAYTVDWGDGVVEEVGAFATPLTHTYAEAGTYTITVSGGELELYKAPGRDGSNTARNIFNETPSIISWGPSTYLPPDSSYLFSFTSTDPFVSTEGSLLTSRATNLSFLCYNSPSLTAMGGIDQWDVSGVTDMNNAFALTDFNGDVSAWDVSAVTNMNSMFANSAFNGDVSLWNVGAVTDMGGMFQNSPFNGNVSAWDVSAVTVTGRMFENTPFNGDLSQWNVGSVSSMTGMFRNCPFDGDISLWNVISVTNMDEMFFQDTDIGTSTIDLSAWTPQVPSLPANFINALYPRISFENLPDIWQTFGLEYTWDSDLAGSLTHTLFIVPFPSPPTTYFVDWGDGSVDYYTEESGVASHTYSTGGVYTIRVNENFFELFNSGNSWAGVTEVINWGTGLYFPPDSSFLFANVQGDPFTTSLGAENFAANMSGVTNMTSMFENSQITTFNGIESWFSLYDDVVNMNRMFANSTFNQPIGSWQYGLINVTNMDEMFLNATNFDQDLTSWCVQNIPSEPTDFATGSALSPANYPVWGTCP